jgi:hypothetical protein
MQSWPNFLSLLSFGLLAHNQARLFRAGHYYLSGASAFSSFAGQLTSPVSF